MGSINGAATPTGLRSIDWWRITSLGAIEHVVIPRQIGVGASWQQLQSRRLHEFADELRRFRDECRVEDDRCLRIGRS